MPRSTKLNTYVRIDGTTPRSAPQSEPCGARSSSTMIVMRIAMTPSLNASSLDLFIRLSALFRRCVPTLAPAVVEPVQDTHVLQIGALEQAKPDALRRRPWGGHAAASRISVAGD